MMVLSKDNIVLSQQSVDKSQAIAFVALKLHQLRCVELGYEQAMLAREQQASTFLGNGIAIPHGTLDARHLVLKTGIVIVQFPQGIDWGGGQKVFIMVGIAALSDDHLAILQALTALLSDEARVKKLAQTTQIDDFIALFGNYKEPFNADLINIDLDTDNLLTLIAENVSNLTAHGYCDQHFLADMRSHKPLLIAENCFICDSLEGNLHSGIAFARTKTGQMVLCISQIHDELNSLLLKLDDSIIEQLRVASGQKILEILQKIYRDEPLFDITGEEIEVAVAHKQGLHARPASALVKVAQRFKSKIFITNIDANSCEVNGKNLMKLLTLGVKCGQRLKIRAIGDDAKEAIEALAQAITDRLGE